jgi:hypothetical protein
MSINNFLKYYFTKDIQTLINNFKNTNLQNIYHNKKNTKLIENIKSLTDNFDSLKEENYNKTININKLNEYAMYKIPIQSSESLKQMAKQCLKKILKNQKILVNNKPIHMKECIIVDILNITSETSAIAGFHTDLEYSVFTGYGFNVWYLIENDEKFGNMFLLESNDYKKKYTPCIIDNNYKSDDKLIPLVVNSYYESLKRYFVNRSHIGYLNKDNFKISYTNLKNGECIVMSKHLLHSGDYRRENNVRAFNFRVIVKNEDGSVDYNTYYKPSNKFPNHKWDQKNKKLYGVKLFDFA